MRTSWNLFLPAAVVAIAAAACSAGSDGDTGPEAVTEKEVLVAHFLSDCEGVGPQQCLNVRESADAEWTLWYDPIEGFDHEAGYDYRLLVREAIVENPPADASALRWTLIEILEKTAVTTSEESGDPMLRAWKLEAFGAAADLGDESTAALVQEGLASLPAERPVTLELGDDGRAVGYGGCNRYFGDFLIENGHQVTQGPKGVTMMACPDGQMKLEQAFLTNLEAAKRVFLRGEGLELESDEGVVLVFVPWEPGE